MTRAGDGEPRLRPPPRALFAASRLGAIRSGAIAVLRLTYRSRHPLVSNRHELPVLLNRRGLTGRAVEVGVREGEFSESILERWVGRELISVDPWAEAAADDYVDIANVEQGEHERRFAATGARLARFGDRSSIWRMDGAAAAERLEAGALDFVYLDARHDRPSVEEDLSTWFPLVRPGGILAGHDYLDGNFPPHGDFGVRSAVDGFFGARGVRVHATIADRPWVSWFVFVPDGDQRVTSSR